MNILNFLILLLCIYNISAEDNLDNLRTFYPLNTEHMTSKEIEDRRLFGLSSHFSDKLAYIRNYLSGLSRKDKYENLQPLIDALRATTANLLAQYLQALAASGVQGTNTARNICSALLGTTTLSANRYFISSTATNWEAAQNDCTSRGMFLATVDSAAENTAIEALLTTANAPYWFGLNNRANAATYVFTANQAAPAAATLDWVAGAPTLTLGRCAQWISSGGTLAWKDEPCATTNARYVCELSDICFTLLQ